MIKKIFLLIFLLFMSISVLNSTIKISYSAWIESKSYMIDTMGLWLWWKKIHEKWAKETIDNWLQIFITKLMVALWVLSLFIMTIGWAYMITAHGKDEMLTKWKTIFTAWLISITVALLSWIIIKAIIFLVYNL